MRVHTILLAALTACAAALPLSSGPPPPLAASRADVEAPATEKQPPAIGNRRAEQAPLRWEAMAATRYNSSPGHAWYVIPERAIVGTMAGDGKIREIEQIRLRITKDPGTPSKASAWLQHVSNTQTELLLPGDPRLDQPGPALDDPQYPWPNACGLSVYEMDRPVDLNGDGRFELVVKRFASVADPAATGLLLLEPDERGDPRMLPLSEIVAGIRFEEGNLTEIVWDPKGKDPVLIADFLPLYKCRFIAQLDIRGQAGCEHCCEFPVVLKRGAGGRFQATYDWEEQKPYLQRAQGDLEQIQVSPPDSTLRPSQEAILVRAAAFYYLTGNGRQTRGQLQNLLGPRAAQPRVQLLLARLDRYFLP